VSLRALALTALACAAVAAARAADAPLKVCIQSEDPPLSSRSSGDGFDVALSRLIADRLGRPFAIQWFVTRRDPDADPPVEANALLSDGRCELVAGYALMAEALGHPRRATGTLPPFEGRKPEDRRRAIRLGELVATHPYRFDALTVVLAPGRADRRVQKLADIADLHIGVEIHSLADLIAMRYAEGRLADHVVHFRDAGELFGQLQSGGLDAGLVDLHQYDAWRRAHPDTRIAPSGYLHSIGFNIGFAGLATNQDLIARVDAVLDDLMSHGRVAALAQASGVTYVPPRAPEIAPPITLSAVSGD
jgi:ABC-type amino acid transport substrate-binding protein